MGTGPGLPVEGPLSPALLAEGLGKRRFLPPTFVDLDFDPADASPGRPGHSGYGTGSRPKASVGLRRVDARLGLDLMGPSLAHPFGTQ